MHLKDRIYLDHNATTPLNPQEAAEMAKLLLVGDSMFWGNPSSIHQDARGPKNIIREAHRTFAEYLGCSPLEIIFNSGASEGNNTVFRSVWEELSKNSKNEFLVSSVEHPSVTKAAKYLESLGAVVKWIPVNLEGVIDTEFIKNNISEKTALISVMLANNEVGTIYPIQQISQIAKSKNILVHADCVQALGKIKVNVKELGVDYATFSAHKFYALKGIGALYVKKGSPYVNLIHGGGQERHRRGGTENILGLWSFYQAMKRLSKVEELQEKMKALRDQFEKEITGVEGVKVTAGKALRLPNTSSLVIEGVDGETLLMSLDLKGFSVSTGAACSSGNPEPSPVLLAMGLSRDEAQSSLRVSLGWETTKEDMSKFTECLISEIHRIRNIQLNIKKNAVVGI